MCCVHKSAVFNLFFRFGANLHSKFLWLNDDLGRFAFDVVGVVQFSINTIERGTRIWGRISALVKSTTFSFKCESQFTSHLDRSAKRQREEHF